MPEFIDVEGNLIKRGLSYAKTHEWITPNETPATLGISDYAQRRLHDVVYVEMPKAGARLSRGSVLCTLESVKAVAETYSPVDGIIVQVNELLNEKPELVNKDPYGQGWLVKIEAQSWSGDMLTPERYSALIKNLLAAGR